MNNLQINESIIHFYLIYLISIPNPIKISNILTKINKFLIFYELSKQPKYH